MLETAEIASLIVRSRPGKTKEVADIVTSIPDLEVHGEFEGEKLVVVLEAPNSRILTDYVSRIESFPDVVSATLIYHHIDNVQETVESFEREKLG